MKKETVMNYTSGEKEVFITMTKGEIHGLYKDLLEVHIFFTALSPMIPNPLLYNTTLQNLHNIIEDLNELRIAKEVRIK